MTEPLSDDDRAVPAWEGVGLAVLGVLAVARDWLTIEQLARFSQPRVRRSDVGTVVARLAQFLDYHAHRVRLFHASFAEFLTTASAQMPHPEWTVHPAESHERIVRAYRGSTPTLAAINWADVDHYGLTHLAEHIVLRGKPGAWEITQLVTAELRGVLLTRYATDRRFTTVIKLALDVTANRDDLGTAVADTLWLGVVRNELGQANSLVTPAVLGLATQLGRLDEALGRLALLQPSLQQCTG